jgi:hypothetical protein
MSKQQTQRRRARRSQQPRDLQVCWANLRKSQPLHITMLQIAYKQDIDVLCVQEIWTQASTRTQNHSGYDCYALVDNWEQDNKKEYNAIRPRVLTYIRKGLGLCVQQRRLVPSRDMLWIDVNKRAILNVYKEPYTSEIINYVTYLVSLSSCLVKKDFNVWHNMFEPGVTDINKGGELAAWSSASGINYIRNLGKATHNAGYILDLSFLNIPFVTISIQTNIYYALDYKV